MTESKATSPRDTLEAVRELNESDPLTARVELMDSTGPAAEAWADRHGFSDYAANEWWPA